MEDVEKPAEGSPHTVPANWPCSAWCWHTMIGVPANGGRDLGMEREIKVACQSFAQNASELACPCFARRDSAWGTTTRGEETKRKQETGPDDGRTRMMIPDDDTTAAQNTCHHGDSTLGTSTSAGTQLTRLTAPDAAAHICQRAEAITAETRADHGHKWHAGERHGWFQEKRPRKEACLLAFLLFL